MTLFRNTVWFLKGLKEYTSSGYARASRSFVEGDLQVDCAGHHYMITVLTIHLSISGAVAIGLCPCLLWICGLDFTTVLEQSAHSSAKCASFMQAWLTTGISGRSIMETRCPRVQDINCCNGINIFVHILDLSDSKGVHSFAAKFCSTNEALHGLIHLKELSKYIGTINQEMKNEKVQHAKSSNEK
ncbi:Dehydrogenase/reductase SDR family member 12 [Portunus trituberculatus]|uniref:Dehydrogenase/reductase SDR family member 12 n=1 Tax=Portunus trituberculatus TaxID=210409 RepID=A0A5B7CI64_PORTR|nr:Dehydrogenase/reductase SDR family member 12 [Portunus trituberculatus]